MWRVGHDFQEKKSASAAKSKVKPRRLKNRRTEQLKNAVSPHDVPKYGTTMMNPNSRHALSSNPDFLTIQRSGIGNKLVTDDNPSFFVERRLSNRLNESRKLSKVKEIQEKIDRVISYYDDAPKDEENSSVEGMLNSIEVGLNSIEDDMLRINISSLIGHHRILQRIEEERRQEIIESADHCIENQETLSALQHWLDQDHLEDINSDEFDENIEEEFNKDIIHGEISHIKSKIHKLIEMKHRIRRLKTSGDNTYHLERQRDNLHEQMKSEVKRLRKRKKSQPGVAANTEYDYLKNATKEVYQLIQKTKLEGMAQANQFEKQLKKILKEMADAKSEISSLQDLVTSQREQIKQWSKDYDKLHNELMITVDERNMARDDSRNLRSEILEFKQKILSSQLATPKEDMITKAEHDEIVRKLQKALRLAKQNLIVVSRALDEKDKLKNDLTQQCNRLKSSLKKVSSMSLSSDSDYQSSTSDLSNVRSFFNNSASRDNFQIYNSSTESLLNSNSEIIYALKKEVEYLRDKLQQQRQHQQFRRATVDIDESRKPSPTDTYVSSAEMVSQETQTIENPMSVNIQSGKSAIAVEDNLSSNQQKFSESVACQTAQPAQLSKMSPTNQVQMSNACRTLAEKIGDDWLDIALKITTLNAEDVKEIHQGLVLENDFKKMFSGSKGNTDSASSISSITKVETIAEKMLRGESPAVIETQYREQERHVRAQVDEMKRRVSSYVSGIREAVNNQAAVMNVVNQEIRSIVGKPDGESRKSATNEDIKNFIDHAVSSNGPIVHENSEMRIEMPVELSKLNPIEQANCKMELIEKTLYNLISETKDIYSTEVEREHQTYKDLCNNALSDNVPEYPVKDPHVGRKVGTIKERVKETVSVANSKVMPKSTARVILKSNTEPDEAAAKYASLSRKDRSIFRHPTQEKTDQMTDILTSSSVKGSRRGLTVSSSKTDQRRGIRKILSGQFWQYSNQSPDDLPNIESTSNVKKGGPLTPINEESSGLKAGNQSIYEKYGKGLGFSRMFSKNRSATKKPNELGLLIQTSSFKQSSTTAPPVTPMHKKPQLLPKDTTTSPVGRMDRMRQVLPHINFSRDNRRTQGALRSGGLGTLGDFRVQSYKASPLLGSKNESKTMNTLTSSKFPFISK